MQDLCDEYIQPSQDTLFDVEVEPLTTAKREVDPTAIEVRRCEVGHMAILQKRASKAPWNPCPGRNLSSVVMEGDEIIGLIHLSSPVINLGVRDEELEMPKDPTEKGKTLRHYMDISVCVGVQPLAWFWNIGKLCAMLAATLTDAFEEKYEDTLRGVTTTGLRGRAAQYNRVYDFLGYTKGYGHEHITDEEYDGMCRWLKGHGVELPSGSNPRMSRIQAYIRESGDQRYDLQHGNKRGVYYHEAVPSSERYDVIMHWYERWGRSRWERKRDETAPYQSGLD